MIILPQWTVELEDKLDKVIKDIAIKNNIDLGMIEDSRAVESGKCSISNSLVNIYENYKVEDRKRLEEFEKDMKKIEKKKRTTRVVKGKNHASIIRRSKR